MAWRLRYAIGALGAILPMGHATLRAGALACAACAVAVGGTSPVLAQSAIWDPTLSNTHWYVPTAQLLAYASPKSGFSNPIPIGDQTLWSIGTATNGSFTGTSVAQLKLGPALLTDTSTFQGFVTTAGQITMLFTPTSGGAVTVGLGHMRSINGVTEMEMQMITGDSLLVTHWAYMLPYDPATFTPPAAQPVPANSVPQWAWTSGTPWRIVSPAMFGTSTPGRFVITNYQNGYFWGAGIAPAGSGGGTFTLLGSVTPEGNVLFNTLSRGTLTSLYGAASGDASGSQMLVSTYDLTGNPTGGLATMSLIQPYAQTLLAQNNRVGLGAAAELYLMSTTSLGWSGSMASGFLALDNLAGQNLSTAINQTLPVFTGAASQATYATQRVLREAVAGRIDDISGLNPGVAPERHFWMKPLGGVVSQSGLDGVPGYNASGGGIAAGVDATVSPRAMLGGMFAYSHQSITGSDDAIPQRLAIDSYQIGLYGTYALARDLLLDGQLDGALNDNGESRSLTFIGNTATARYRSYTGHAGAAIRKQIPVTANLTLTPSLRLDYGEVRSAAYQESGAGGFSLNVDSQVYRELTVTAGVKSLYRLAKQVYLTADAGVGYNTLNQGLQINSAFSGGGSSFVTSGLGLSPWIYSANLGLVAAASDKVDVGVRYGVQATSSGLLQQSGFAVFKVKL
ncbi:autotransporter outer membrane beta-barrel domain-containing protein [Bradyrhizobium liaoningense]|uniref:autotransporter family protein n=1 Tax=Bradyrhizobium liaoningense TaxID=43992 RepID=UPI001BAE4FD0|nr:autotransporter outer membrane beta-barrel domain-containing protein [Bradyrhizobium liaoningense]MBR0717218.1 autotransporter outer membrane beta-barrel domain-containing protein [Bradyrhizobium liaoningense]